MKLVHLVGFITKKKGTKVLEVHAAGLFEDGGSPFLDTLVITFKITNRRIQGSSNIRRHAREK